MKSNELRIGNKLGFYFQKNETSEKILIATNTVVSIYKNDFECNGDFPENMKFTGATFEPINLNHEFLEKCLFLSFIEKERTYKHKIYDIFLLETSNNKYSLVTVHQLHWCAVSIKEIEYLHQLQNLYYSLTGEELEINLTDSVIKLQGTEPGDQVINGN